MKKLAFVAIAATLAVTACETTDPYTGQPKMSDTSKGALIGAGAGAALGALTNTSHGNQARNNALIGAGIGALVGAGIGNYMDRQQAELAAELRGTGVSITKLPGNQILLNMPSNVTFPTDGDQVNSSFYPVLTSVSKVLAKYNQTLIDVRGHTDNVGAADYNQALSERRANGVANYLISHGIDGRRLLVTGYGETQPIASNATPDGRAQNRRVEIQISPYTG